MTVEEDIKRILDNDEEIVKLYRPNKKRFVNISFLFVLPFYLIPIALLVVGILGIAGVIKDFSGPIGLLIFGGVGLIFLLSTVIGMFVRYNKTYYIVSTKRLIIRGGFIGVDYKSIPLSTVGLVDVRVDFLDKLAKKDTGTIIFGSASSPVINQQNMIFAFHCIDNPYETYKEVKEIIFESQNKKES